jgi:hypothetical protein
LSLLQVATFKLTGLIALGYSKFRCYDQGIKTNLEENIYKHIVISVNVHVSSAAAAEIVKLLA